MEWLFVWNRAGSINSILLLFNDSNCSGIIIIYSTVWSFYVILNCFATLESCYCDLTLDFTRMEVDTLLRCHCWDICSIDCVVWKALGLEHSVKNVNVRKASSQDDNIKKSKWKLALEDAWGFFYPLLPYLLIGVFIGAFIYDFIPQEFIVKYAGGDKPWTIPIASIVGIPMYIRAEAI